MKRWHYRLYAAFMIWSAASVSPYLLAQLTRGGVQEGSLAAIIALLAFLTITGAVGILLWRGQETGKDLLFLLCILQVFQFGLGGSAFAIVAGAQLTALVSGWSLTLDATLGSQLHFVIAGNYPGFIGINFLALAFTIDLARSGKLEARNLESPTHSGA